MSQIRRFMAHNRRCLSPTRHNCKPETDDRNLPIILEGNEARGSKLIPTLAARIQSGEIAGDERGVTTRGRGTPSRTNQDVKRLAILRQRRVFEHVSLEFLHLVQDRSPLHPAGCQSWGFR